MQRGKVVVVSMLVLGLGLAVFAWQWNRSRGRYAAEFWGAETAKLIRSAPKVEVFKLEVAFTQTPQQIPGKPLVQLPVLIADDTWWSVLESKDVSKAPGLLHARNALLEDASFKREHPSGADPLYKFAVRFSEGEKQTTLFLDPDTRQIRSDRNPANGELVPKVAEGWRKAFERYFEQTAATTRQ